MGLLGDIVGTISSPLKAVGSMAKSVMKSAPQIAKSMTALSKGDLSKLLPIASGIAQNLGSLSGANVLSLLAPFFGGLDPKLSQANVTRAVSMGVPTALQGALGGLPISPFSPYMMQSLQGNLSAGYPKIPAQALPYAQQIPGIPGLY